MSTKYRTILLNLSAATQDRRFESVVSTTIYPGMLISEEVAGTVKPHATKGGQAELAIALEASKVGMGTDLPYSAADLALAYPYSFCSRCEFVIAAGGDELALLLKKGTNYAKETLLMSAGDGTFETYTAPEAHASSDAPTIYKPIAILKEAVDLSPTAAPNTLAKCRIL